VTGLPQEEDEFILGRVSDIARAAGIALAADQCRVNLYLLGQLEHLRAQAFVIDELHGSRGKQR
jgi:hypothetical protein